MNTRTFILALAATILSSCATGPVPFPEVGEPYAITSGPHDHLFANYFGINAWSPDNRYVAVLETDVNGRLVNEDEAADICLVDLQDGNRIFKIAQTYCWNFQEAAMFHWLPDGTCLYNDRRDGKFVTVVMNWRTKEERHYPFPVSAVSEDGSWAVSINYARLFVTRPDYGYAGEGQDARKGIVFPYKLVQAFVGIGN